MQSLRVLAALGFATFVFVGCSSGGAPREEADASIEIGPAPALEPQGTCSGVPDAFDCGPSHAMCDTCFTCGCNTKTSTLQCMFVAGCCTADSDCTPYKCNGGTPTSGGTCYTTCSTNSDCTSGTCNTTTHKCVNWQTLAGKCSADTDCASGHCTDGVCCSTACGGSCQACNVFGSAGTCTTLPAGSQAKTGHPACPAPQGGACGSSCNGIDGTSCHFVGSGTSCGSPTCNGTTNQQTLPVCDGAGTCGAATSACLPYICDPAKQVCCTSCTTAGCGCQSGYLCTSTGTCALPAGKGSACSTTSDCSSGLTCSPDKVCCDSACTDTVNYTCSYPGKAGSCLKKNGIACTAATQCASGNCVDGVCCDSACTGECASCNQTGKSGTCSPIPAGQQPLTGTSAARPPCSGTGAGTTCGPSCNGTDTTTCHYAAATATCSSNSCSGGVETHLSTCSGSGTCTDVTKTCSPYACGATACKTSCTTATSATDCAAGFTCDATGKCVPPAGLGKACPPACGSGTCVGGVCCATTSCPTGQNCSPTGGTPGICGKNLGQSCSSSTECGSGFCVDGVCCNSACTDNCAACDVGGKVGTCSIVSGQPHGTRACAGTAPGTTCGTQCDGKSTTSCSYPDSSTTCGAPTCTGDTEHHVGVCDGTGACNDSPKKCGAYACGTTTCKTTCTGNIDCQPGFQCKSSVCQPLPKLGDACTTASECPTGFCTDGVCCGVASCGTGKTCAGSTSPGVCTKANGTACAMASDCASGFCVDGVCCDKACNGQCEACDVTGTGTCALVPEGDLPHGTTRPKCSDGGGDACKSTVCDGKDRSTCAKLADTKTVCSPVSCAGETKTGAATCDGMGNCGTGTKTSCSPYACAMDGKTCRSSCSTDGDCASGFICQGTACVPKAQGKCSDDGLSFVPTDPSMPKEDCAPYVCQSNACIKNCGSSADCAPGNICDVTSKNCVPQPNAADQGSSDSGGCGCSVVGGPSQTALGSLAGLALAIGLVRRRRR